MKNSERDNSIAALSKLWNVWSKVKWYLVAILLFVAMMIFYKKDSFSTSGIVIWIVFLILFLIVILIFNDNKGLMGNSVMFAVNPLPPHLGLDGVSNEVRASY